MTHNTPFASKLPCKQCHKKYHVRTLIENLCPKCRAKRPFDVQQSELFYRHHAYKEPMLPLPRNLTALNKDELELALKDLEVTKDASTEAERKHKSWAYAARMAGKVDRHAHYADLLHELSYLLKLAVRSRAHQRKIFKEQQRLVGMAPSDRLQYAGMVVAALRSARRTLRAEWDSYGGRARLGNWQAWLNDADWESLEVHYGALSPARGDKMKSPYDWRSTPIPPRTGK